MKRIPQNEIYRILSGLAGTVGLYVDDTAILGLKSELQ